MSRNIYIQNTPLNEAQEMFMEKLKNASYFNIETEYVDVTEAHGRISSCAITARRSSPHYISAAMDGIAVKAATTFGANELNPVTLDKEQYIEVDTGDYVPQPFDAVIMIEEVNFIDDKAQIIAPAVPWQHIRSVGEDLVAHDMIIPSFTRIGPFEIGSLLTAAVNEVPVVKKPRVAIIPTGTELISRGSENMEPGEIVESNSHMLSALCKEWGAIPIKCPIVIDDKEKLRSEVLKVIDNCDMLVICSGSSAGREDYTAAIIRELGEVITHGLAIKPGKPAILGMINNKPAIGVPGYPISAQLIFNLFARPVLYKKQGLAVPEDITIECQISRKLASNMGVDEFVYANVAKIKDDYVAYPLSRGAGITTSLVKADGYIHIKRGSEGIQAGEKCLLHLKESSSIIDNTIVTIGSHDLALDYLADIFSRQQMRLISSNVGSMGGLLALKRGETHLAGIHLLDTDTGEYNIPQVKNYLKDKKYILVNLVKRQQGLIVKKNNPYNIQTLNDVIEKELRFINRQKGSGTRILLDYLLKTNSINPDLLNGYNREEYTHWSVAASVKNDACDVGLGIYAAAKAMNLDFIPITEEQYDLCILTDLLTEKQIQMILNIITSSEFKSRVENFGGYSLEDTGKIVHANNV